jgi:hypothetical protein
MPRKDKCVDVLNHYVKKELYFCGMSYPELTLF